MPVAKLLFLRLEMGRAMKQHGMQGSRVSLRVTGFGLNDVQPTDAY